MIATATAPMSPLAGPMSACAKRPNRQTDIIHIQAT
jgi:hypothetical protein